MGSRCLLAACHAHNGPDGLESQGEIEVTL